MKDLLLLTHRIPFPPNKGDKIRSFHLLRYLNQHYRVHLGTFVDDPADEQYIEDVRAMCTSAHFVPLNPKLATLRSAVGLLTGQALSLPYYWSGSLARYVRDTLENFDISRAVVFSSAVAQFATPERVPSSRVVVDFVDIDSDKWRQYVKSKSWPMSWVYKREAECLERWERKVSSWAAASVFVSKDEAELYKTIVPESAASTDYYENGVDTHYFDPAQELENPFDDEAPVFVFTGAMDYWANVDAVVWFADLVFPKIREQIANAKFYIVGIRPAPKVIELGKREGIVVTGTVPDVRPFVHYSTAAVAPLRIARGVQNKVLEALSMGKPVLATSQAVEGIEFTKEFKPLVADEPAAMADMAVALTQGDEAAREGMRGREFVLERYNWDRNLSRIQSLLEQGGSNDNA